MAKFLLVYHGGDAGPPEPAEMEQAMAAWTAWFATLGDAVVDAGDPVGETRTVSADGVAAGGGANPAIGYSLIEAPDLDAAVDLSKGCPLLAGSGGSIEVCATVAM